MQSGFTNCLANWREKSPRMPFTQGSSTALLRKESRQNPWTRRCTTKEMSKAQKHTRRQQGVHKHTASSTSTCLVFWALQWTWKNGTGTLWGLSPPGAVPGWHRGCANSHPSFLNRAQLFKQGQVLNTSFTAIHYSNKPTTPLRAKHSFQLFWHNWKPDAGENRLTICRKLVNSLG